MFFLIRSAICIAMVVAALPDAGHGRLARDAADLGSRPVATAMLAAEHLCRTLPDRCAPLIARAAEASANNLTSAGLAQLKPTLPSRDTLNGADRRHPWTGPLVTASN